MHTGFGRKTKGKSKLGRSKIHVFLVMNFLAGYFDYKKK